MLILPLFIPIFTYSIYQFLQFDENEQLIQSIYDRQLEQLIYSVNQWGWDNFMSWHSELVSLAAIESNNWPATNESRITQFAEMKATVSAAFLRFSSGDYIIGISDRFHETIPDRGELIRKINSVLNENDEQVKRLIGLVERGYDKPLTISWKPENIEYSLLICPIVNENFPGESVMYCGMLIDNLEFIIEYVERRFNANTQGEFIFAIQKQGAPGFFYFLL